MVLPQFLENPSWATSMHVCHLDINTLRDKAGAAAEAYSLFMKAPQEA